MSSIRLRRNQWGILKRASKIDVGTYYLCGTRMFITGEALRSDHDSSM